MARGTLPADVSEPAEEVDGDGLEQDQYLVFTAMEQEFGIQAMRVQEISAMVEITTVPRSPAYIEGILNLRGRLVSVVNFRKKFGFEARDEDEDTRIIIVEHRGFPIGILVDSVEEVIRIPDEKVQKLPEAAATTASEDYLSGVGLLGERLIILLDADELLSKTDLLEVEAVRRAVGEPQPGKALAGPPRQENDPRGQGHRGPASGTKEGR